MLTRPTTVEQLLWPNRAVDRRISIALVSFWVGLAALIWVTSPFATLPTPGEVWHALGELWWKEGLGPELFTTIQLIFHALAYTVILAMGLAYASVIALFRPLVVGLSKLRFLGLTGLVVPFTLATGGGYQLKVALLTFGMASFFLTSMAQVVLEIPREQFDHMRVLGAKEGRIVWEVVVRGTLDRALDVLRQNVAIGWSMITMVEGISRSDGGLGALILNENKHFRLAEVFAMLIVILVLGLAMDAMMAALTRILCPHVELERLRR